MSVLSNKAKWLLLSIFFSTLFCIGIVFLVTRKQLEWAYHGSGFYFMFATFFFWIFLILPRKNISTVVRAAIKEQSVIFLLIAGIVSAILMVSSAEFRILADETNLLGIASSMYDSHAFYNTTQGLFYYGSFHEVEHVWGIRPIFFPFLIYLAHTILGYSAYNGFIINALAGAMSLWCFYWLLSRFFQKSLAIAGMITLAAYPVFVLWVTSSGFEIVNLLLVLIAFCYLYKFLQTHDTLQLERLVVTLVLLSQTRYESAVFVVGMFVAVVFLYKAEYLENLSWRAVLWPVLFLPILCQRLLKVSKADYQVYNDNDVFSVSAFFEHSVKAVNYFFEMESRYGTIALIAIMAIAGVVLGSVSAYKNRYELSVELKGIMLAAIVSYILLAIALFAYYWGDLTASFTIRLGIVFLPLVITLAVIALHCLLENNQKALQLVTLGSILLIFFYWPVAAKNEAVTQIKLYRYYKQALTYLDANFQERNIVIVTDRPGMYAVHRWGAVNFDYANANSSRLISELSRKLYQDILVIQTVNFTNDQVVDDMQLDSLYTLDLLFESQTTATNKLRISRVNLLENTRHSKVDIVK